MRTGASQYLYDLADEPGHRLQLEFGDVVVESVEEQIVVGLGKDHLGEQVRDDPLRTTTAMMTTTVVSCGTDHAHC